MKRCFGIKKNLSRCKNERNVFYCGFHKRQPIYALFLIGTALIFFTDLSAALGFKKKPIEYITSKFKSTKSQNQNLGPRTNSNIRLGVIDFINIDLDKNGYNQFYSDELNKLAALDSLMIEAYPINFSKKRIPSEDEILEIASKNDLDIVVWGKVNDKNCSDYNQYCVNYQIPEISNPASDVYSPSKSLQEFNQGRFKEFLSGEFSGDLHKILYYFSAISQSLKGNYINSNYIIKKNKFRNQEDNNFKFWEAYNSTRLNENDKAIGLYQEVIRDTPNSCEKYYLSSISNLASLELSAGRTLSNLDLNIKALYNFKKCNNQDSSKLTLLYNYVAQSYNSAGKKDSSRYYHKKAFNLIKQGIGNENDIPVMLSNMAAFSIESANYESATNECLLALEYVTENHNEIIGIIYYHLGLAKKNTGDFISGILSLRKAKDLVEEQGKLYDASSMAIVSELGWSAFMTNNDSIISEIKTIIDSINVANHLSPIDRFRYYEFNAAYNSLMKSKNEKALELYKLALIEADKIEFNNEGIIASTYSNISGVYGLLGNVKMEKYYDELYRNATDNKR